MARAVCCPVCNGNGMVSAGFYSHPGDYPYWVSNTTNPEKCRSCDGRGWIPITEIRQELLKPVGTSAND